MTYNVIPSEHVLKYLKKLKEKTLKSKMLDIIYDEIAVDPYKGKQKVGDLSGVWAMGFKYADTTYRIAYTIGNNKTVSIILCGTHENFYEQVEKIRTHTVKEKS